MASSSTKNRLRLAAEIQRNGRLVAIPCDRCFVSGHTCIAMENASRLRCSECVRLGRPCVNLSWESLDRTREEYQKKIDEDEELLAQVLARLMRNKKILKQAEQRASKKANCLMSELDSSGDLEVAEDCPAAGSTVGVSPAVWSSLNFLDEALGLPSSDGNPQLVPSS